jgi:hypothetical protein
MEIARIYTIDLTGTIQRRLIDGRGMLGQDSHGAGGA